MRASRLASADRRRSAWAESAGATITGYGWGVSIHTPWGAGHATAVWSDGPSWSPTCHPTLAAAVAAALAAGVDGVLDVRPLGRMDEASWGNGKGGPSPFGNGLRGQIEGGRLVPVDPVAAYNTADRGEIDSAMGCGRDDYEIFPS